MSYRGQDPSQHPLQGPIPDGICLPAGQLAGPALGYRAESIERSALHAAHPLQSAVEFLDSTQPGNGHAAAGGLRRQQGNTPGLVGRWRLRGHEHAPAGLFEPGEPAFATGEQPVLRRDSLGPAGTTAGPVRSTATPVPGMADRVGGRHRDRQLGVPRTTGLVHQAFLEGPKRHRGLYVVEADDGCLERNMGRTAQASAVTIA